MRLKEDRSWLAAVWRRAGLKRIRMRKKVYLSVLRAKSATFSIILMGIFKTGGNASARLKEKLAAYADLGEAREWFDQNYRRVAATFENPSLRGFIFEPIERIWSDTKPTTDDKVRAIIMQVAVANALIAGLPGKLGVGVFVCMALEAYMAYAIARRIGVKLERPSDVWKYFGLLAGVLGTVLWGFRQLLGLAFSAFSIIPGISPLVPAEFFVTCLVGVLFWTGFDEAKKTGSFKIPVRLLMTAGKRTTELFGYQWRALSSALSPSNLQQMGSRLKAWLLGEIHEETREPRLRGKIFCAVAMAALLQGREDELSGPLSGLFLQSIRDRFPDLKNADAHEIASFMQDRYDEDQIGGVISLIKGKLFEHVVEAHENADGDEWIAHLHEDESYPGSDIVFTDTETGETIEVSLKATESAAYIEHSLMRYPDIPIFSTSEVGGAFSDVDLVTATEFSNEELTAITKDNFDELLRNLEPLDTEDAVTATTAGAGAAIAATLWPFVIAYLRGRIDQEQLRRACIRLLPKAGQSLATKLVFSMAFGPVYAWYVLARLSMSMTPTDSLTRPVRRLSYRPSIQ
jgi:hypothetical protein